MNERVFQQIQKYKSDGKPNEEIMSRLFLFLNSEKSGISGRMLPQQEFPEGARYENLADEARSSIQEFSKRLLKHCSKDKIDAGVVFAGIDSAFNEKMPNFYKGVPIEERSDKITEVLNNGTTEEKIFMGLLMASENKSLASEAIPTPMKRKELNGILGQISQCLNVVVEKPMPAPGNSGKERELENQKTV